MASSFYLIFTGNFSYAQLINEICGKTATLQQTGNVNRTRYMRDDHQRLNSVAAGIPQVSLELPHPTCRLPTRPDAPLGLYVHILIMIGTLGLLLSK